VEDLDSVVIEDGDDGCCSPLEKWTGPLGKEGDMGTAVKPVQNGRGRRRRKSAEQKLTVLQIWQAVRAHLKRFLAGC